MIAILGMVIFSLGIFFLAVSVVGVLSFPDFYARVHAAGIGDSVGVVLALAGLSMQYTFSAFTIKILVLICFLCVTSTTTCNILTNIVCGSKGKQGSDKSEG